MVQIYRSRGYFVVGGLLFNHESPRRGPEMVTRKITQAVARWANGDTSKLRLGNVHAARDWGFAKDYVRAMHAMLQQAEPRDYVIGTGEAHSVLEFLHCAIQEMQQRGGSPPRDIDISEYLEVDPALTRPCEIQTLCADISAAQRELGWEPTVRFRELVRLMVYADIDACSSKPDAPLVETTSSSKNLMWNSSLDNNR